PSPPSRDLSLRSSAGAGGPAEDHPPHAGALEEGHLTSADAALVGIGATLSMDLWNLFLKRTLGWPSLDYCLLGRWLGHLPSGTFRHERIAAASPKPHECAVGRIAHYTIGVSLALVFVLLVAPAGWPARPTVLP